MVNRERILIRNLPLTWRVVTQTGSCFTPLAINCQPYLYHVGYQSSVRPDLQKEIDSLAPSEVEQAYIEAGREHLLTERDRGRGQVLGT